MVSFTWKFFTADPMDILWRVDTPTFGTGLKTLEGIDVCCPPLFGVTIILHHPTGTEEIDVGDLDNVSRENARRLLKHLKYQKAERWSWRRATEEPEALPAVNVTHTEPPVIPCSTTGTAAKVVVLPFISPPAAAAHHVPTAYCA
jgi:hypothetical protein